MNATAEYLKSAIEYAPANPGPIAANLLGWKCEDGTCVCAKCAGRIMARGCRMPRNSEAMWSDRGDTIGVCCCCYEN